MKKTGVFNESFFDFVNSVRKSVFDFSIPLTVVAIDFVEEFILTDEERDIVIN